MGKNFVIFFTEKEGTTALVQQLANFEAVSIVRAARRLEPFDRHECGDMPNNSLRACLDMVLGQAPFELSRLNAIYCETSARPLDPIEPSQTVGFKMRFIPKKPASGLIGGFRSWNRLCVGLSQLRFERMMIDVLERNNVVAFVVVRQDTLRWALSKYHGDGTGEPGHLQFELQSGKIRREDLDKIDVDCDRLARIIAECEAAHRTKRRLITRLRKANIPVVVLRYEEFLSDKPGYLARLFDALDVEVSEGAIKAAIDAGTGLEKVHSDDLSTFVENHAEVLARFGGTFERWPD